MHAYNIYRFIVYVIYIYILTDWFIVYLIVCQPLRGTFVTLYNSFI